MKDFKFKVANMRTEQEFTLYPYTGGDEILLQSDKRFARFNLRTGEGHINGKNKQYANSISLALDPLPCKLPEAIRQEIQEKLWHNDGKQGNIRGVCVFDNEKLFSK